MKLNCIRQETGSLSTIILFQQSFNMAPAIFSPFLSKKGNLNKSTNNIYTLHSKIKKTKVLIPSEVSGYISRRRSSCKRRGQSKTKPKKDLRQYIGHALSPRCFS